MKKPKKETMMEAAKTPIGTTILLTMVFIILLIVFTFIKNRFLAGVTIDTTIIFLGILPFIFYLAVSGKISEFKGGGFEFKFNTASNAEVSFKSEEVVFAEEEVVVKGSVGMLREKIMPKIAEKPTSVLSLVPGEGGHIYEGGYNYEALKEYLEELTKFDFFKYVLFVDEDKTFKGYIHARNLLAQLLDQSRGYEIINKINSGNVEGVLGFKKDFIKDYISNREALKIMEKEGITEAAVVDKDMKFKGFTNQDIITTKIVNNLMTKTG